jgi:hypothetical protein
MPVGHGEAVVDEGRQRVFGDDVPVSQLTEGTA